MMKVAPLILQIFSLLSISLASHFQSEQDALATKRRENSGSIMKALRMASVVPDVLDNDFRPELAISLTYTDSSQEVRLGNEISPANASHHPVLDIIKLVEKNQISGTPTTASNKTFTLVLSDPDATSRANPVKGQMCHWIATNIVPEDYFSLRISQETKYQKPLESHDGMFVDHELVEYMPPGPPPKTGLHRYVFVLLEPKQPEDSGRKLIKPHDRPHFGFKEKGQGVMDWADQNHLRPIAANFFYAKNAKQ